VVVSIVNSKLVVSCCKFSELISEVGKSKFNVLLRETLQNDRQSQGFWETNASPDLQAGRSSNQ